MITTMMNLCAGMALMAPMNGHAPAEATEKPAEVAAQMTPHAEDMELLPVENLVIERTNQERARRGLRPLRMDPRLVRQARRHTAWMTRSHNFQHSSDGVGENIAMGQRDSKEALNAWMNSDGHRANILNTGYTKIGVAAYIANNGSVYWCQQFSR